MSTASIQNRLEVANAQSTTASKSQSRASHSTSTGSSRGSRQVSRSCASTSEKAVMQSNPALNRGLIEMAKKQATALVTIGDTVNSLSLMNTVAAQSDPSEAAVAHLLASLAPNGSSVCENFISLTSTLAESLAETSLGAASHALDAEKTSSGKAPKGYSAPLASPPSASNQPSANSTQAMFEAYAFLLELMQVIGENSSQVDLNNMDADGAMMTQEKTECQDKINNEKKEMDKNTHESKCHKAMDALEIIAGAIMDIVSVITCQPELAVAGTLMLADGILDATGLKTKLMTYLAKHCGGQIVADLIYAAMEVCVAVATGGLASGAMGVDLSEMTASQLGKMAFRIGVQVATTSGVLGGAIGAIAMMADNIANGKNPFENVGDPSKWPASVQKAAMIATIIVTVIVTISSFASMYNSAGEALSAIKNAGSSVMNGLAKLVKNLLSSNTLDQPMAQGARMVEQALTTAPRIEPVEQTIAEDQSTAEDDGSAPAVSTAPATAPLVNVEGMEFSGQVTREENALLAGAAGATGDAAKKLNLKEWIIQLLEKTGVKGAVTGPRVLRGLMRGAFAMQLGSGLSQGGLGIGEGVIEVEIAKIQKTLAGINTLLELLQSLQALIQTNTSAANQMQQSAQQTMIDQGKELSQVINAKMEITANLCSTSA